MKHFFTIAIALLLSTITRAQMTPVFPVDTTYTSYDSLNGISTFHHTIRIADASKPLDKSTSTTIWKTTDSVRYVDKANFLFMHKTTISRQHECVLMNKYETATIYDPSGTSKTFVKEDDKKSVVKHYDKAGKLLKTEKAISSTDFYKSVQPYYVKKKK
ncbi:MAG: hypothetical protein JNL24_02765 [Bacteroidia bacterium]|nr:hypothetical protein [Bacteroidia bacterium]